MGKQFGAPHTAGHCRVLSFGVGVPVALQKTRRGALITAVKERPMRRRLPTLKAALANFKPGMIERTV